MVRCKLEANYPASGPKLEIEYEYETEPRQQAAITAH